MRNAKRYGIDRELKRSGKSKPFKEIAQDFGVSARYVYMRAKVLDLNINTSGLYRKQCPSCNTWLKITRGTYTASCLRCKTELRFTKTFRSRRCVTGIKCRRVN